MAYVRFAVDHRAHFEVMFRPDLYHPDDPRRWRPRDNAPPTLSTAGSDPSHATGRGPDLALAGVAAWCLVHGFATLWLNRAPRGSRHGAKPRRGPSRQSCSRALLGRTRAHEGSGPDRPSRQRPGLGVVRR